MKEKAMPYPDLILFNGKIRKLPGLCGLYGDRGIQAGF